MKNKGFLMIVTISELFSTVFKELSNGNIDFSLKDSFILICSRDIVTDTVRRSSSGFDYQNAYQSKYKNVEFITSLLPSTQQIEFVGTGNTDSFVEEYMERLTGANQMKDIISICDVVVNRNMPVFIVTSSMDMNQCMYPQIIRDFIKDVMGLKGYMMDDISNNDFSVIFDYGDPNVINENIESHKKEVLMSTDKEYFFNTLVDDMEKAYREILETKSEDELKVIAKESYIFISRKDTKEKMIEKIMKEYMGDGYVSP